MDNQKYLVIITLIDGQNFTVPEGAPDKIEASVFAEARFGAESVLRSDPIALTNSNPEFVTELAWQLDRRSLHQLRVERKAIKLQVFLQTKERKKSSRHNNEQSNTNGWSNDSGDTHKVELIGYTILDLRSAQLKERPKFQWLPLLNPKFRKPSYNRPEIQLAITLSRLDDETQELPSLIDSSRREATEDTNGLNEKDASETDRVDSSNDTKLFTTCLETTTDINQIHSDEIIDNDIIIRYMNDVHHIYDANHPQKCKLEDCIEPYEILISVPFGCGLDSLLIDNHDQYFIEVKLFGVSYKTTLFDDLTFTSQPAEIRVQLQTTHSGVLATYFELNPNLDINLHSESGNKLGVAAVQLNQLCSLDMKCRSIEGIFVMQPVNDHDHEPGDEDRASIGVSIILEKRTGDTESNPTRACDDLNMAKEHFGDDIDEFMFKSMHDTHQLTAEPTTNGVCNEIEGSSNNLPSNGLIMEDHDDGPGLDDHHYCFTIDLKKFTYSFNQKLIPTLRELVIRYSYPFFGYKDTITTDASIPINANSSIIVSGFCEFNFATTPEPLLTALRELALDLEILAFDDSRLKDYDQSANEKVAYCNINLAEILKLDETNIKLLEDNPASETTLAPIYALSGEEIGHLQVYLCLKDLGRPSQKFKASIESLNESQLNLLNSTMTKRDSNPPNELRKVDSFIAEMKKNFETWKEEFSVKLSDDLHKTNSDRLRRLYQRVEAKEAKRDQEIRKKIDELEYLEKKFKSSLSCVENLEKMLSESVEQMRVKNSVLDAKLEMVDVKISQLLSYNNRLESKQQPKVMQTMHQQRSFDDHLITNNRATAKAVPPKNPAEKVSPRRSSLKTQAGPSIPLPIRSSSLVRGPVEGTTTATRIVKRASGVSATVINGINSRVRSNSARLNLSKDTQDKLANLRKEKAELLKRGCKPTDELIQEINSLIEKLAC